MDIQRGNLILSWWQQRNPQGSRHGLPPEAVGGPRLSANRGERLGKRPQQARRHRHRRTPGSVAPERLRAGRHFSLAMEGILFLTVLHRWLHSGSDRSCVLVWKEDYTIPGIGVVGVILDGEGPKFTIDEEKVKGEERFDGKWVLQTDLEEMTAEEAALAD